VLRRVEADTTGEGAVDLEVVMLRDARFAVATRKYIASRPLDQPFIPANQRPMLKGEMRASGSVVHL